VKSEPEQRIPASEITRIHAPERSYDITWYHSTAMVAPGSAECTNSGAPDLGWGFRAVLVAE
jgi:hypothetical protein